MPGPGPVEGSRVGGTPSRSPAAWAAIHALPLLLACCSALHEDHAPEDFDLQPEAEKAYGDRHAVRFGDHGGQGIRAASPWHPWRRHGAADYAGDIDHDLGHFRLPGCAMLADRIAPARVALERLPPRTPLEGPWGRILVDNANAIRILVRVESAPPRARQDRSRRTAERILAAALELLAEQSFEQMTVGQIAARAGVSVGGFYARFAGKEALLEYLNIDLIDRLVERARSRLSPEACAAEGARAVVQRYLAMAVDAFRRHRGVLRQVALRSRASRDAAFRERVRATNRVLHDLLRARLDERLAECAHPEPRLAIDIALTAVSGAMREHVLFQEPDDGFIPLDDARLVAELTDLFCAYLRLRDDD